MAITVNSIPEDYASVHDDLWFVVDSTNKAQTNFRYVFDVYINSVQVARVKQFPDPGNDKGIFNAGDIIRGYAESYFTPNPSKTLFSSTGDEIYVEYEIKFGEEYGGTLYTNLVVDDYVAFNYYNPVFRDPSTSYFDDYVSEWLSNRDFGQIECGFTDQLFIGWMNASGSNLSMYPSVQLYNEDGTTSGSAQTTGTTSVDTFTLLDISPTGINNHFTTTIIPATAYAYGIKLHDGTAFGPEVKVKLVCNPNYAPINLHFLNQLGGYETFGFRTVNKESRTINRKSFTQEDWVYQSTGTKMSRYDAFNRINAGSVPFSTEQSITYRLKSNYINVKDHTWLRELIASPEVYMEQEGYLYPVTITTNNWEEKKRVADKMFTLELDVELGSKTYSQFR
jgi:hypothetical protein